MPTQNPVHTYVQQRLKEIDILLLDLKEGPHPGDCGGGGKNTRYENWNQLSLILMNILMILKHVTKGDSVMKNAHNNLNPLKRSLDLNTVDGL